MKKQAIYTVDSKTDTIIRRSKSLLSAFEFAASLQGREFYLCTSEFNNLKKGDPIVEVTDTLNV